MNVVEPFNRDYASELYDFLIRNPKNNFFHFGIPLTCSLSTFLNYYTQEIIDSAFSNSKLTNNEHAVFFTVMNEEKILGLFLVIFYLKKIKKSEVYIEILFDEETKSIDLITISLNQLIEYIKNNFNFEKGSIFFGINKKDLITKKAIRNNNGEVYNESKDGIYLRINF